MGAITPRVKMAWCLMVFLAVLTSAAVAALGPVLTVTTTVLPDGDSPISEIAVNGVPVIRMRAGSDSYSCLERAEIVADRLRRLGELVGNCEPGIIGEAIVVKVGEELIVTVDARNAALNACSRTGLALIWAENLQSAVAASSVAVRKATVSRGGERIQTGVASWYGAEFHGRGTASGEVFDQNSLTAAHRTLPFGTVVLVTNDDNGRQVLVRINDRGPWTKGRIIDLSQAAAEEIGLTAYGIVRVTIELIR